jgi:hypothetical protein
MSGPFKDRSFQTKRFQLLTAAWTIHKTNRVSMRTGKNAILVEYVDMIAHEQEQKESKKRLEKTGGNQKITTRASSKPLYSSPWNP